MLRLPEVVQEVLQEKKDVINTVLRACFFKQHREMCAYGGNRKPKFLSYLPVAKTTK